jgi:hypothetical protein
MLKARVRAARSAGQRSTQGAAMMRPWVWAAGAGALTLLCMVLIPIQRAATDFSVHVPADPSASSASASRQFQRTRWPELMPDGWDPYQSLRDSREQINRLRDTDPRAGDLLLHLREAWSDAPTNPRMANADIRLPGYLVPLQNSRAGISEFLLVPYFGACIHAPPPPSNQVVLVRMKSPLRGLRTMDAVWVHGTLQIERAESSLGASSYAMAADRVEKLAEPQPQRR